MPQSPEPDHPGPAAALGPDMSDAGASGSDRPDNCLVPDCTQALAQGSNRALSRLKICKDHQVAERVAIGGKDCRFCQRCARFHPLSSFDDKKRSCRSSLEMHNLRRRRNRAEKGALKAKKEDIVQCLVDDCSKMLDGKKGAHRRYRFCTEHQQASVVIYKGEEQRFCQQCSRFHLLQEFDGNKRSCRVRLESHNSRRRRLKSEASGDEPSRSEELESFSGLTAADLVEQRRHSSYSSDWDTEQNLANLEQYYARYFSQPAPGARLPGDLAAAWNVAQLRQEMLQGAQAGPSFQSLRQDEMPGLMNDFLQHSRLREGGSAIARSVFLAGRDAERETRFSRERGSGVARAAFLAERDAERESEIARAALLAERASADGSVGDRWELRPRLEELPRRMPLSQAAAERQLRHNAPVDSADPYWHPLHRRPR